MPKNRGPHRTGYALPARHHTDREPRRVEFSRIYGKQATFIFDGEDVISFGDDADNLGELNFFGS